MWNEGTCKCENAAKEIVADASKCMFWEKPERFDWTARLLKRKKVLETSRSFVESALVTSTISRRWSELGRPSNTCIFSDHSEGGGRHSSAAEDREYGEESRAVEDCCASRSVNGLPSSWREMATPSLECVSKVLECEKASQQLVMRWKMTDYGVLLCTRYAI